MSNRNHNHGFPADHPASYAKIEWAARMVGLAIAPRRSATEAIPGLRLLENIDEHHVKLNDREIRLNYAVQDIPVEALTRYADDRDELMIVVSPDTYQGLSDEVPRARFCLCHEIGHAALHSAQVVRMASIPHQTAALMRGEWPDHPAYRDTEWQANAFASALLMPADGLAELSSRRVLTAWEVQRHFRVSDAAARVRISTFEARRHDLLAALSAGQCKQSEKGKRR